jgi:hypothetical protein
MKLKLLTAFTCLTVVVLGFAPPLLRADEKQPEAAEPAEEDPAESLEPPSAEELEERLKEEAAQEKEQIDRMMKVFTTLEGSWTGRENLRYEEDVLPAKSWKDEWEGKFTYGGRYFEMLGQASGEDLNSAYKWICTWDVAQQRYRAWYFGDTSHNEYAGKLSADGTHVIWSIKSPNGATSRFTMKAEGSRVKCHGTDVLADGSLYSTHTSEYTRKRVEL